MCKYSKTMWLCGFSFRLPLVNMCTLLWYSDMLKQDKRYWWRGLGAADAPLTPAGYARGGGGGNCRTCTCAGACGILPNWGRQGGGWVDRGLRSRMARVGVNQGKEGSLSQMPWGPLSTGPLNGYGLTMWSTGRPNACGQSRSMNTQGIPRRRCFRNLLWFLDRRTE